MAERIVKVTLRAEIAQYREAMDEAARKTRETGTESEKLAQKRDAFQKLGTTLLGVGAAMTAVTLSVAKTGIEYNTLQQTSRAALTTLLGGAKGANEQMDRLDAFARTSPFAKTTFITAQQQMLAFGIESKKVIPYLDAIGEAVAAAGGSNQQLGEIAFIMAQISSAGKITGQDLMQFGQRGVNAAELIGSQMGKTGAEIRQQITDGTLGADQALDALAAGMKEKFDGASANVKMTFVGALDRVKAAWRDLSSDLMTPLVDPSGGGALVDFLNWTADVLRAIQALPEPVKLAGGALFAFAGFVALASGTVLAATPRIIAMKTAFMALSGAMRGFALAGGIAVIALTAVVAIVGAVAAAQAAARAKAEAYADTLAEGSREITDATRDMIATNLTAEKSFMWVSTGSLADNAEMLGLSLSTVTDAVAGNAEALAKVNAAIDTGINEGYKPMKDANLEAYDAAVQLKQGIEDEVGSLTEAEKIARQKAEATREAAEASKTSAEAYQDEAKRVSDLNSQLTGLIDTINAANGIAQDAVTANARYQSALAGISEEVQKQRDEYEKTHGTLDGFNLSLDQNTESGSKNAAMLADVAAAAQNAAEKQYEQDKTTMGAEESTKKYVGTLQRQRDAFVESAIKAGFNKDEVNKLADSIYRMPSKKEIDVLVDTASAQDKIDTFVTLNNGKRVKVYVDAVGGQSWNVGGKTISSGNAEGGVYHNKVKAFAGGGFEPGIYPFTAGGIHKFAEEYGEAYISMDPRRRERSEQVYNRVGREMGFGQSQPVVVNLDDMRIQGTLDLGNGLTGFVDGRLARAFAPSSAVAVRSGFGPR